MNENADAARNVNLHAPWRSEYMDMLNDGPDDGCFLCRYRQEPDQDERHLVLWRAPHSFVVMNRFPYTGGHLLVAPLAHVGSLDELDPAILAELMGLARDCTKILAESIRAEGFNIGLNLGRCAGAGLPGHLHLHVVPRWPGDTNFLSVLGDVRVIPHSLPDLRRQLLEAGKKLQLPTIAP